MTEKQEAYIEYLILEFSNYLERISNYPNRTSDARFIIQEQTLAALKCDFYTDKASLTSRQALQTISALNAYSERSRVEIILRLTFFKNVKRLKDHLVSKGINPYNLSTIRRQVPSSLWDQRVGRLTFPLGESQGQAEQ